jgi:hypothetical protein
MIFLGKTCAPHKRSHAMVCQHKGAPVHAEVRRPFMCHQFTFGMESNSNTNRQAISSFSMSRSGR